MEVCLDDFPFFGEEWKALRMVLSKGEIRTDGFFAVAPEATYSGGKLAGPRRAYQKQKTKKPKKHPFLRFLWGKSQIYGTCIK